LGAPTWGALESGAGTPSPLRKILPTLGTNLPGLGTDTPTSGDRTFVLTLLQLTVEPLTCTSAVLASVWACLAGLRVAAVSMIPITTVFGSIFVSVIITFPFFKKSLFLNFCLMRRENNPTSCVTYYYQTLIKNNSTERNN
jgi:hypothetical protein